MPKESVGEAAVLYTADHPARKDSPEYIAARKVLMNQRKGGCIVCGGIPDMTHPEMEKVGSPKGLQDHHGGGIYVKDVLVGLTPFGMEWSLGWSASPAKVAQFVANLNVVLEALGEPTYDSVIKDTPSVMAFVDSKYNANVKLCAPHHVGRMDKPSKDAQGHEAVGIHEIPYPIWLGQMTCDWDRWDMWAGTSGTIAVAPNPDGTVAVLHASDAHPDLNRGDVLKADHPLAMAARR
ncbi:hypothetical protein Back2_18040 [Nocardioides baekrokdamisoli]|uniref:Uncharacterized protein n=1 Tax=Nocardioides baekrokdamisoli TaxID=1804624 RepID=A0A3G9IF09_9ACTN|nr:DUF6424 family protein [Nocardioides baekrokdamisoli]BBH17517.1 hypothetical protein Back2_18040 [Nocardioides baekrokdamisoli]